MRVLALSILFIYAALAQETSTGGKIDFSKEKIEIPDSIKNKAVGIVKEKEVDGYLKSAFETDENFASMRTDCEQQNTVNKDRYDCINKKFTEQLGQQSSDDLKKLSENLELSNYELISSETDEEIIGYLGSRLDTALYGEDFDEVVGHQGFATVKKGRFVSHEKFYDLYDSQISKNLFTEISGYCLENFRIVSYAGQFNETCVKDATKKSQNGHNDVVLTKDKHAKYVNDAGKKILTRNVTVCEREYDAAEEQAKVDGSAAKLLEDMRNNNSQNSVQITEQRYNICLSMIPALCKAYKDNTKAINQDGTVDTKETQKTGRKACGMVARLKEYKKAKMALGKENCANSKDQRMKCKEGQVWNTLNEAKSDYKGVDASAFYEGGTYKGDGTDGESVSDITNINSKDIGKNIDDEFKGDALAKEFEQKCAGTTDGKCDGYIHEKEVEFLENAKLEHISSTKIKSEEIKKMDENQLEEYAKKEGYEKDLEDCKTKFPTNAKEQSKCIGEVYEKERLSVIREIDDKLKKMVITEDDKTDPSKVSSKIATRKEVIADQTDRIERVYRYNNIVTSFLSYEKDKGNNEKEKGSNYAVFETELEGADKADLKYFNKIKDYHSQKSGGRTPTGNNNGDDRVELGLIDRLLGFEPEEENP